MTKLEIGAAAFKEIHRICNKLLDGGDWCDGADLKLIRSIASKTWPELEMAEPVIDLNEPADETLMLREQKHTIEELEKVLADAKSGSVVEFIGLAVHPDTSYRIVGSSTQDKHTVAGMLLEAAIERLEQYPVGE